MVPPPTSSFHRSSSSSSKRSSQALYNRSVLSPHMFEQCEAWLTSDSLHKRPRLESAINLLIYPQRPGEKDCTHYMLTRTCKFGETCKFDHPIWVPAGGIPDWKEPPSVPFEFHPERPGAPDCPHFLKTQQCKFGLNCKFNHPKDKLDASGKTNASVLPERPSEPLCSFYMKTGICKFGVSCKFHHPKDAQVPSDGKAAGNGLHTNAVNNHITSTLATSYNSKGLPIRLEEEDCPFYMKTGSCKYGANCRYNHPDINEFLSPFSVINAAAAGFGRFPVMYPQRPGQNECEYYMKTGDCKYGETCKYHHPIDRSAQNVKFSLAGLPRREGVQHCPFYMKTGTCKYGVTCKFDHPPPGEVIASAGNEASIKVEEESEEDGENVSNAEESKGNGDTESSDEE